MREIYDREKLREVIDQFDLVSYVEQSYDLKRHGNEYAMRCPIHSNDDTPSMFINPSKQRFYCHACHAGGTILDWLIKVEHLSFPQAVEKINKLTGAELEPVQTTSSLTFFRDLQRISTIGKGTTERVILPDSYYEKFDIPATGEPHEWIEEGITQEMIAKYDVRIDTKGNRIVYKVFDNEDNFIGVKGRTRFQNYKLLGIKKYCNYQPVGTTDYFQGMHENRMAVTQRSEAIIFEGIKSVMIADSWGYQNCVSAETSLINDAQAMILIRMQIKDVVLAFDNDVTMAKLKPSIDKLRRFMNVWIIIDKRKQLGEKMAPVDAGKTVWDELYRGRFKIE